MKTVKVPTFSYWRNGNTLIMLVQGGTQKRMKRVNAMIKQAGQPLEWRYEGMQPPFKKEEEHVDIDVSEWHASGQSQSS